MFSRMVAAFVMLGVFASFVRLFPAAVMLGATFLLVGTVSAIKRESTGEPFQVSDLFLTGQAPALLGYVGIGSWLAGYIYDVGGSYTPAFALALAGTVVATMAIAAAMRLQRR